MASPIDPEVLQTWTTSALVLHIARYAQSSAKEQAAPVRKNNAEMVARELNIRVPPRRLPQFARKPTSSAGASTAPDTNDRASSILDTDAGYGVATAACAVCGDTGAVNTGTMDDTVPHSAMPCQCPAGDTQMFNGPYGRETGAAIKARARRDGT